MVYIRFEHAAGCTDMVVVDSYGSIYDGRDHLTGNPYKQEVATKTNRLKN